MTEYTNLINAIIQQGDEKRKFENYTVQEWFEKFLTDYCSNLKSSTLAGYQQATQNHINRILGDIFLKDLNSDAIQFFVNALSKGDNITEKLSPKSVKNVYGVLHKGLSTAYKLGYTQKNIKDMFVVLPKVPHAEISPLTINEISLLLSYIKGSKYELIIRMAVFTGLRESELLGLKWSDIDFQYGTINVVRQYTRDKITHEFILTTLKSGKSRLIVPATFLMAELQAVFLASKASRNDFVFVDLSSNEHMKHNAVYRFLKKSSEKAFGRSNVRFHDLRHTYAVLSLQAGDDYKTLQENMGHYSAAFTLDRYGHCTIAMKVESAKRMDSFAKNLL